LPLPPARERLIQRAGDLSFDAIRKKYPADVSEAAGERCNVSAEVNKGLRLLGLAARLTIRIDESQAITQAADRK